MKLKTFVKELKSFAVTLFDVFTAEENEDLRIEWIIIDDESISVENLDVDMKNFLNSTSSELRKRKDAVMSGVKGFEKDEN